MSLLVERLEGIVSRFRAKIKSGSEVSPDLDRLPEITRERLLELIEEALMRVDELGSEGVRVPTDLSVNLSTLRALVEETKNYQSIERGAVFACALALAIIDSARDAELQTIRPYLERLREEVLRVAEQVFSE